MSCDGNEPYTTDGSPKQQEGTPLPFLGHDFKGYHNTEWFQWELNHMEKKMSMCSWRITDAWKLKLSR
eukprot:9390372-Ditylum_brightwellii.AAC.1